MFKPRTPGQSATSRRPPRAALVDQERGGPPPEKPTMKETLTKFGVAVLAVVAGLWLFNKIGAKLP